MKVDFALHAALRGVGPRVAALRGAGLRGAGLHRVGFAEVGLRGIGPGRAGPGDAGLRGADLRGAGPRVAAPGSSSAIWPARAAITRWWRDRSASERRLLAAFAALVVIGGVARLVWTPLVAARQAAQAEITRDDRIAAELRVAGPEVARIAAARRGTLATVVTAAAAQAGLTVARLEPQGADVAVGLDGVGFDALVDWLAALDRDAGVVVVDLKVERRPDPGLVSAQVTLTER